MKSTDITCDHYTDEKIEAQGEAVSLAVRGLEPQCPYFTSTLCPCARGRDLCTCWTLSLWDASTGNSALSQARLPEHTGNEDQAASPGGCRKWNGYCYLYQSGDKNPILSSQVISFRNARVKWLVLGHAKPTSFIPLSPVKVTEAGAGRKGRREGPLGIFPLTIFPQCALQCSECSAQWREGQLPAFPEVII